MIKKILLSVAVFAFFFFIPFLHADTLTLKDGRQVNGEILKMEGSYIELKLSSGESETYFLSDISKINGRSFYDHKHIEEDTHALKPKTKIEKMLPEGVEIPENILEFFRTIESKEFQNEVEKNAEENPFKFHPGMLVVQLIYAVSLFILCRQFELRLLFQIFAFLPFLQCYSILKLGEKSLHWINSILFLGAVAFGLTIISPSLMTETPMILGLLIGILLLNIFILFFIFLAALFRITQRCGFHPVFGLIGIIPVVGFLYPTFLAVLGKQNQKKSDKKDNQDEPKQPQIHPETESITSEKPKPEEPKIVYPSREQPKEPEEPKIIYPNKDKKTED